VGDPAAGKTASATCAACHGEQGVSTNPAWPSLAGQDARYLASALKAYKDGSRSDATMKPFVASLDDKTINDIASYYAGLRPAQPSTKIIGPAKSEDPVLVSNRLVAGLDERTINDIASYFASLRPAQPAAKSASGGKEPVLISNGLVASLDDRAINDVASYFASLRPTYQSASGGGGRAPIVNGNRVMASLDERSIGAVASYYATLRPEQPASARNAPAGPVPPRVGLAAPIDGSSIGGIISFRKDDPSRRVEDNNAICLNCHERGQRTYWQGSTHEIRGVACSECHTLMKSVSAKYQLKTAFEPNTCFQCHKDRQAQMFRSSHMPLREGKIVCSSCHNPHGSPYIGSNAAMLWENSINDNCYKCHAEKRGPFLFEHAPVRENCLNCHDPHGSINEYSLKMSRPRLCYECHTIGHGQAGLASQFTESRSCQNCHTLIHGSNSPAGADYQR
jgi:DmsE family decaheme c-type cytochrome